MVQLSLRDVPPALLEQLKQRAAAAHRSVSSETIEMLERGLARPSFDLEAWRAESNPTSKRPDSVSNSGKAKRKRRQ